MAVAFCARSILGEMVAEDTVVYPQHSLLFLFLIIYFLEASKKCILAYMMYCNCFGRCDCPLLSIRGYNSCVVRAVSNMPFFLTEWPSMPLVWQGRWRKSDQSAEKVILNSRPRALAKMECRLRPTGRLSRRDGVRIRWTLVAYLSLAVRSSTYVGRSWTA